MATAASPAHLVNDTSWAPPAGEQCQCSDLTSKQYTVSYALFNFLVVIFAMPLVSLFGLAGNVFNLYIYTRPKMRAHSANVYLAALAVSDFFLVVTGVVMFWIDSARAYLPALHHSPYLVVYTLPFGYLAQTCSVYIIVAAAVDCYVKVYWRQALPNYCTPRRAVGLLALVFVVSACYNCLRFGQFALRTCRPHAHATMVEICPTELFFQINVVYNVYMYMILMTFVPFFLLSVLNALIARRMQRRAAAAEARLKLSQSPSPLLQAAMPADVAPRAQLVVHDRVARAKAAAKARRYGSKRRSTAGKKAAGGTAAAAGDGGVDTISPRFQGIAGIAAAAPLQMMRVRAATVDADSDDTVTMIMVVLLFLLCNTLALVINIVETFGSPDPLVLNFLTDASNFLVILNSSVNFVIYMIFSRDFYTIFCTMFQSSRSGPARAGGQSKPRSGGGRSTVIGNNNCSAAPLITLEPNGDGPDCRTPGDDGAVRPPPTAAGTTVGCDHLRSRRQGAPRARDRPLVEIVYGRV